MQGYNGHGKSVKGKRKRKWDEREREVRNRYILARAWICMHARMERARTCTPDTCMNISTHTYVCTHDQSIHTCTSTRRLTHAQHVQPRPHMHIIITSITPHTHILTHKTHTNTVPTQAYFSISVPAHKKIHLCPHIIKIKPKMYTTALGSVLGKE